MTTFNKITVTMLLLSFPIFSYGRYYDPRLSKWISPDPILENYLPSKNNKLENLPGMGGVFNPQNLDLYHYSGNNPIKFTDPDGKKTIWLAGAGDDNNSAAYSVPMVNKMSAEGIKRPEYLNLHHPTGIINQLGRAINAFRNKPDQSAIDKIKATYDRSDGQFNLVGYSKGAVDASHAALQLSKDGKIIDNLILIGSPISPDSQLYKELHNNENIRNITTINIDNDFLTNENGNPDFMNFINSMYDYANNQGEIVPHFHYTNNNNGQQDVLVRKIKEAGVK